VKIEDIKKNPKIYVLIGLPGSGKSTWRNKLLSSTDEDFAIVSSDDFIDSMAEKEGKTYTEVFDKYIGAASKHIKDEFKKAVAQNKSIIYDRTNMSQKSRRGILAQLPKYYEKIAVDFQVSDGELKRRLEAREEETGKGIPAHVIKSMSSSYNAPTKAEGFDRVINVQQ